MPDHPPNRDSRQSLIPLACGFARSGWRRSQAMKASGGKANPQAVNALLKQKLGLYGRFRYSTVTLKVVSDGSPAAIFSCP